jgi:hypothetical protein
LVIPNILLNTHTHTHTHTHNAQACLSYATRARKLIQTPLSGYLSLLFFITSCFSLNAQTPVFSSGYTTPALYYFPIDRDELLYGYGNNGAMLDALDRLLDDPAVYPHILSIRITAAASPVAPPEYNDQLAKRRAGALRDYILQNHPGINRNTLYLYSMGIDWEGFRAVVESDTALPARTDILTLLDHETDKKTILLRLRTTGGEPTWQYLLHTVYPQLQYATFRIRLTDGSFIPSADGSPLKNYVEKTIGDTLGGDNDGAAVRDTMGIAEEIPVPEEPGSGISILEPDTEAPFPAKKGYYFGLKTNLLYDAAGLPNLSAEFPFSRYWSAVVEGNWSWWDLGKPYRSYHRIQAAGVELRRWFASPRPLAGHAIGLYASGGTYDIRLRPKGNDSKGWLSNSTYSIGLSYARSIPLARRLHLELGLAAGYWGGRYYDYKFHINEDHRRWEWTAIRQRRYWGPTRVGVSLVWIIGKKGDAR